MTTLFLPPLNSETISVGTMMSPKIPVEPGDCHAPLQAFANRILAVALHLEDVPIHLGCLRRRPASLRSALRGDSLAPRSVLDFRLRRPRRFARRLPARHRGIVGSACASTRRMLGSPAFAGAAAAAGTASGVPSAARIAVARLRVSSLRLLTASSATRIVHRRSSQLAPELAASVTQPPDQTSLTARRRSALQQSHARTSRNANNNAARKKIDQNHHQRAAKQFAPRRPRNLVHLCFDGDQKIGKRRHVHQPKRQPHAQRPRRASGIAELQPSSRTSISNTLSRQAADQHRPAQRPQTSPAGQSALASLVNAKLKQLAHERHAAVASFSLAMISRTCSIDSSCVHAHASFLRSAVTSQFRDLRLVASCTCSTIRSKLERINVASGQLSTAQLI